MELSNDNWRHIFTYLTSTDLILLKTCDKHLYGLVSSVYGNNLYYDIIEIVYRNYYSLFINYLHPLIGTKECRNISYYIGLGCSKEFAKCVLISSRIKIDQLLSGGLRSGNLEFIKWVCGDFYLGSLGGLINITTIVRSMSIECVEYMLKKYKLKCTNTSVKLHDIMESYRDLIVGFKVNLTVDYIKYLTTKRDILDEESLLSDAIHEDMSIVEYLLNRNYLPDSRDFDNALTANKCEIAELYLKANPQCVEFDKLYSVSSKECYDFIKSHDLQIDMNSSLELAIYRGNKQFITFLYSQGRGVNEDILQQLFASIGRYDIAFGESGVLSSS